MARSASKRPRSTSGGSARHETEQTFEADGPRKFERDKGEEKRQLPVLVEGEFVREKHRGDPKRGLVANEKAAADSTRDTAAARKLKRRAGGEQPKASREGDREDKNRAVLTPAAARSLVASLATKVTSNPEKHIAELVELRKLRTDPKLGMDVRALAFASEAQVYADIVPGYAIRALTAEERAVKVSKDVLKTRQFEEQLRSLYEKFVDDAVRASASRGELASVAASVLAALLTSLPHFNRADSVASAVVANLDNHNLAIADACSKAVADLLSSAHRASEAVLGTCVKCAEEISRLAEKRRHRLPTRAAEPLLHVQVGSILRAASIAELKEGKNAGAKGKKGAQKSEAKELVRDMQMAQAETSSKARRRAADRLLSSLCMTYVRVLHEAPVPPTAFSVVLSGINRISNLLSQELTSELIDVVSALVQKETLPTVPALEAIAAFFEMILKQQQATGFDPVEPTRLEALLRRTLRRAGDVDLNEESTLVVVRAVEAGIKHRRGESSAWVTISRILLQMALTTTAHGCAVALVAEAKRAHPNPSVAFDPVPNQSERADWSVDVDDDPGGTPGADTGAAWELVGLAAHFHPTVAALASQFALGGPAALDASKLLHRHRAGTGGFNPAVQQKPSHVRGKRKRRAARSAFADDSEPGEATSPPDFLLRHYVRSRLEVARLGFAERSQ